MSPLQVRIVAVRGLRINFETMVVLVILVIDIDTGDSISDMLVGGGVVWRRWWSVEMMVAMVVEMMVAMVVAMDREKEEVVVGGLGTEVRWVLSGLAQASSFIC